MSRASSFLAAEPGGLPFEVIERAVGWWRADDGLQNLGKFGAALDLTEVGGPVPTVVGIDGRLAWRIEKGIGNYLQAVGGGFDQYQPFNCIAVFRYHTAPVDGDTAFGAGSSSTRVRALGGNMALFAGADFTQAATLTDWNCLDWFSQADIGGSRLAQVTNAYTPYPMPTAGNIFNWQNAVIGNSNTGGAIADIELSELALLDGAAPLPELGIIWPYFRRRFPSMGLLTPNSSFADLSLGLPSLAGKKVYILMGQSNCVGRAAAGAEAFDGVNTFAVYLDGSYALAAHPLSDDTNIIDPVYKHSVNLQSCWAAFANKVQPFLGTDVVLVPCNRGSTTSAEWRPDASTSGLTDTRASLFGAALYRAQQCIAAGGDVEFVYYQGEEEIQNGVDSYETNVTDIITTMQTELGYVAPFIVVKYGWVGANVTNEQNVHAAEDNLAALPGVSTTGATWGFGIHYDGPESNTIGLEIGSIVTGPRSNALILADSVWGLDMYDAGTYTEVANVVTALSNARTAFALTVVGTPGFDATGLNGGPCLVQTSTADRFVGAEAAVQAAVTDENQFTFMAIYQLVNPDSLRPLFGWADSTVDTNNSGYIGRNSTGAGHFSFSSFDSAGAPTNTVDTADTDTNPHIHTWRGGAQKALHDIDGVGVDVGGGAAGLPVSHIIASGTLTPNNYGIWVKPDLVPTTGPGVEDAAKASAGRLWPYILPSNERAQMLSYLQSLSGL